jgi:hypothetical protein
MTISKVIKRPNGNVIFVSSQGKIVTYHKSSDLVRLINAKEALFSINGEEINLSSVSSIIVESGGASKTYTVSKDDCGCQENDLTCFSDQLFQVLIDHVFYDDCCGGATISSYGAGSWCFPYKFTSDYHSIHLAEKLISFNGTNFYINHQDNNGKELIQYLDSVDDNTDTTVKIESFYDATKFVIIKLDEMSAVHNGASDRFTFAIVEGVIDFSEGELVSVCFDQNDKSSGSGTITEVNGQTGPVVTLDAGDVGADPAGSAATAQSAAQSYADGLVTGLWDDRGSFDASVNAYPSSGGSGTAGAIRKGDIWTVSVAGTLPTGVIVEIGDTVRALIDTPGNTQANWAVAQNNIGYVPENLANKDVSGGYVGLSGWSIKFRNLANTFTSLLQNAATAVRTYTFPDKDITVAGLSDIQNGQTIYVSSSGTDTYIGGLTPALTAYVTGMVIHVRFPNGNTGPATINIDGLGAKSIRKNGGATLSNLDIVGNQVYSLLYDGTNFHIIGIVGLPASAVPALITNNATTTHTGTTAETKVWSAPISANTLITGDLFDINIFISATSNANNKTYRLYMNTTDDLLGTPIQIGFLQVTTVAQYALFHRFVLVGSTTSQRVIQASVNLYTSYGNANAPYTNLSINLATNQFLILTNQCANSGDTMITHMIKCKIIR